MTEIPSKSRATTSRHSDKHLTCTHNSITLRHYNKQLAFATTGYLLALALELARSRGAVPGGPRRSTCGPAKLGWPEELRGGGTQILWCGELLEGGRLAPLPVPEPLHRGSGGGVGDSCAELEHGLRAEIER